jgi:hypothetical protein
MQGVILGPKLRAAALTTIVDAKRGGPQNEVSALLKRAASNADYLVAAERAPVAYMTRMQLA